MNEKRRNMLQNATFCSREQEYTKDIPLFKRLFPALTFSGTVRALILLLCLAKRESIFVAKVENISVSLFIIIY